MRDPRVYLDLVRHARLGQSILPKCSNVIREERVIIDAHQAHRRLDARKVLSRHKGRMSQRTRLDERPIVHRSRPSLLVCRRLRGNPKVTPAHHGLALRGQLQDVLAAEAVADGIHTAAVADGVGELVLGAVEDLVQDGRDLLLGVAREPHVDEEALGGFDGLDLEVVEEVAGALGGLLGVDGGRVGRHVAVEEVGHDDDVAFGGELVGLDLVVGALEACAAGEEEDQPGGRVGILGWLGDVDLDNGAGKQGVVRRKACGSSSRRFRSAFASRRMGPRRLLRQLVSFGVHARGQGQTNEWACRCDSSLPSLAGQMLAPQRQEWHRQW